MIFRCQFPECNYSTEVKSQINCHHIKPVELSGSDYDFNRIYLCPTHHTKIFIPEARCGIHSIRGNDSIIIVRWLQSTGGPVLEYIDVDGEVKYLSKKSDILCKKNKLGKC